MINRLIISTLIFFISLTSYSQNNFFNFSITKKITQCVIDKWGKEQGLPTNSINDICQTKDGYIWMASYSGLIRFDANKFTIFDKSNTSVFKENGVLKVAEGKDSTLWIVTQSSGLISYKNGRFKSYYANDSLSQLSDFLFIDKNDNIWVASPNGKLFYYKNGELHSFNFLNHAIPEFMIQDKNNAYWIGLYGNGLIKYDGSKIDYITTENGLITNWINAIYEDDDLIWIGTDQGLCSYDGKTFTEYPILSKVAINSILKDNNGNFWLGTTSGLYFFNPEKNEIQKLDRNNGLSSNFILKLFVDDENSLWIVSYKEGISRLRDSKFTFFNTNEGFEGNLINTFCEIEPNDVLVGFDNGKIDEIKNNEVFPFKLKSNLENARVRNIYKDSKQNLWISTYSGLLKVDKNGNEFWYTDKNGLPDMYVRLVFEDSKKNIWIGTRNAGLVKINSQGNKLYFNKDNGLRVNLIMSIDEDINGNIIIGTSKGGVSIIKNDKVTKTYTKKDGLSDDIVFKIYVDKDNIVWIAAKNGLNYIKDDKLKTIPYDINLLQETPYDILEDKSGGFWMPCSQGIMFVKKQELFDYTNGKTKKLTSCFIYTEKDGLKESECNSTANSIQTRNGMLWFPTIDGAAMINPNQILKNRYVPPVYIDKITVDTFEYSYDTLKTLVLSPNTKRITISFNVLSYYEPKFNYFRYKLDNFDTDWSDSTTQSSVTYTNLKHGKYTLKVIGCNNDGVWNQTGAEISFVIKPHFYETWLFWIIIVILAAGLIYLIYILRIRSLLNKQKNLEILVNRRTAEITEKNEELKQQNEEITLQKEEIEQQSTELEKLSIVARNTDNVVMIFDEKLVLIWSNHAYSKKYYDFNFNKEMQISLNDLYKGNKIKKIIQVCRNEKKSLVFESKRTNKFFKTLWVQCTLTPIIENEKVIEYIVIESDISKIKKAELELRMHKNYITESISYARYIQDAMFPNQKTIENFYESFIIFKPKDIVSGDFYWFANITFEYKKKYASRASVNIADIANCSILALVDCTGHGVPGAFMSMLGFVLLNEIILHRKIFEPQVILNELNENIRVLLHQDTTENSESMDIGMCFIKKMNDGTIDLGFSGAKLSLYYYNNHEASIKMLKGDRKTIGGFLFRNSDFHFTNYHLNVYKNDRIYLSTDGYIDQANPNGKRFGTKNFIKLLNYHASKPLDIQKQVFEQELDNWKKQELQRDDISLVCVKF